MIGWVTQGLTKVLPQPDDKYKETQEVIEEEEHTEVCLAFKLQHLMKQINTKSS